MSKIGKKIPGRSCLTEAILVIGKKIVRFEMFDEVGVKTIHKVATIEEPLFLRLYAPTTKPCGLGTNCVAR